MNPLRIVVARYEEPLTLLEPVHELVTIYNKGTRLSSATPFSHVRDLANVGREAHSYLTYIIDSYESLPEVVVFTQGEFEDHLQNSSPAALLDLASQAARYGLSLNAAKTVVPDDFRLHDYGRPLDSSNQTFGEYWREYISTPPLPSSEMYVYWGAIFATRRDRILSRSKEFYERVRSSLLTPNPEAAHFVERAWFYILQHHELLREVT